MATKSIIRRFKNLTPREIALYSCSTIAILIGLFYVLFQATSFNNSSLLGFVIFVLTTALVAYSVNLFFIRRYIFRKIKLIYKNIHQLKLDPSQKFTNADVDSEVLEQVEKDVEQWAKNQQKEIDNLKTLENYRREFLGNVSHELKTPIFNIQGYIHTLIDGGLYDENINEKYLLRAAKNVKRLITIVDDLENISKLESGRLVLDIQGFDIKKLTLEVFETHELQANENNIKLALKEGADKSFMVKADREYVRQVLDNLVLNSIKYGKANGRTKISFYDMDKFILIEVSDNGIGIEEKHLKHVFDRFYRVDKSRSRDAGGSGLGLAIVKHIVEAHNQTINVRSSPKLGSTFGFTLEKA